MTTKTLYLVTAVSYFTTDGDYTTTTLHQYTHARSRAEAIATACKQWEPLDIAAAAAQEIEQ